MTHLEVWAAICEKPVVLGRAAVLGDAVPETRRGKTGHRLTHAGGQANPIRRTNEAGEYIDPPAPAWVTPRGCDLGALHAAHSAYVIVDRRGEHRECGASAARVQKPRRRRRRVADVIQIRRTA